MSASLDETLNTRTWRELRAIAHAHGLRFNTNLDKAAARTRLLHELLEKRQLRRSFRTLSLLERAALAALQAGEGQMPLHEFIAAFGPIRPYKPWRNHAPVRPWRRPVSAAERLWFLGFVQLYKGEDGRPRTVRAPVDVLKLLPPLPRPRSKVTRLVRPAHTPDALRFDVAAFLGTLQRDPVKPRWRHWLPPWAFKAINARFRIRERLDTARSELQTERLRFVHYLAEISGLISVQGGDLLPTPAAWQWLDLPPEQQWDWLWSALERDIGHGDSIWTRFRFPAISPTLWHTLIDQLRALHPDRTYTLHSLIAALRPYAPIDPTLDTVPDVLRGPFNWMGVITAQRDCFMLTEPSHALLCGDEGGFTTPAPAALHHQGDAYWLDLPEGSPTRAWASFVTWGTLDHERWCIDAESITRAVEQGFDVYSIARVLDDLCGEPLARPVFEQIEAWARRANRLVLRQMTVLTSPDANLLAHLRQDRRLRPLFGEPLSAHHSAVPTHAAVTLTQHLARRGYPVTTQIAPSRDMAPPGDLTPDMAAYLWLAARTYRHLGAFIDLPVRIPGALEHWLADHLPAANIDALQAAADHIRDDLARTIDGYAALPPPIAQDDPAAIRAAVDTAYATQSTLTVEYFSPGYGAPTIRTIAPLLPVTESGGAEYFEAWCHTAEAPRTFRLDRILRLIDEPVP